MGKKKDKKKSAGVINQEDDIDSLVAEIESESTAPKQRRKKKKHVVDDWDNDDLSHGIEMLTIKSTKQKEESIVAASPEDSDEADEDDFALIKNQKGKMMQELLQWDELGDDDDVEVKDDSDDDDNESVEKVQFMQHTNNQSKKGKKKKKKNYDDWEDDIEKELEMIESGQPPPEDDKPDKSKAKKKRDKRRKGDDWEDDIEKELGLIASGQTPAADDKHIGDRQDRSKPKGRKDKRKKDDDREGDAKVVSDEVAIDNNETEEIEKPRTKTKGKKSKMSKEVNDWEDDIEKELEMIASGQAPAEEEKSDKPKTKGKKERKNREDKAGDKLETAGSSVETQKSATDNKDAQKQNKQGKKGRRNRDADWEDDISNELAKIESGEPPEKADDKQAAVKVQAKPKKRKGQQEKAVVEKPEQDPEPAPTKPEPSAEISKTAEGQEPVVADETTSTTKKKKKKGKKDAEEEKSKKKPSKAIRLMQEALKKRKEEEERLKREEEERLRKEEEAYQKKLAEIEAEKKRKEKKRLDKKERIRKQKEEGTYLTPSQREAKRRREAYLKSLLEQGIQLPTKGQEAKLPKYGARKKQEPKKPKSEPEEKVKEEIKPEPLPESKVVEKKEPEVEEESESSEDDWEAIADKDETETEAVANKEEESSSDETSSSEESEEEEEEQLAPRERALNRIEKLRELNERNRSTDNLRSPVICVMGHVDTGKTKILDKIRHTNVQDGEAGGITQQIGATNIPVQAIKEQTKMVEKFSDILVPGLLVIDTPGHESFSNLRSRGSSNCDMAILVVDIMHGLEPQTIESINMLRKKKTPYVVALNKIDRLYQWKPSPETDVVTTIRQQTHFTMQEFQKRVNEIIVQFAEQQLNVKLFYENDDPDTWISMVPTSAHSGDGMGNLMAYVVQHCQTRLAKRLSFSENLQCTVLEVKAIQGLGTTVDVILTNGRLKYGDVIVLAGTEGPIVTHVKGLLMPQPLKELRVKNPYDQFKEVKAAQGVKVLAKELDKSLAGTSLLVARQEDEVEILKDEVQAEVDQALKGIKLQERGVFVQASTLGSLEALLEFLKQSKIPYAGINIGPVHKRDVMKASVMLEHDDQWAVILAFDVKVEREAQELADSLEVRIFTADIIYHLFDAFMKHREDLKRQKQDEFRNKAVFPCKLKIVPNCVFKSRDPIVVGVSIEAGQLRVGTPVCVPGKDFLNVGVVASIESNHKPVEIARKPQEVCIKIEGAQGEAPKMVGRHFDETDILTSKISRDSIDLLKNWFREEMQKSDWQLIIELKKLFDIM